MLGLLWYLQRAVAKRVGRRSDAAAITVLGRQGLGAKAQLVVVRTEDAKYVLGVTEHGVTVIDRLAPGSDAAPDARRAERTVPRSQHASSAASDIASDNVDDPHDVADDDVFAALLASASEESAPEQRLRVRHRSDPLRGSILSPDTWRQTAEALRRTR